MEADRPHLRYIEADSLEQLCDHGLKLNLETLGEEVRWRARASVLALHDRMNVEPMRERELLWSCHYSYFAATPDPEGSLSRHEVWEWLKEREIAPTKLDMEFAIDFGDRELIRWIADQGVVPSGPCVYAYAVRNSDSETLDWLESHDIRPDEEVIHFGLIQSFDVAMLERMEQRGLLPDEDGPVRVFQLYSLKMREAWSCKRLITGADRVAILDWMYRKKVPFNWERIMIEARKWLNDPDCAEDAPPLLAWLKSKGEL